MSKIKLYCKDKVLEFLWRSQRGYENYIVPRGAYWSDEFELVIEATGEISIWKPIKGGQDRAEKDLNPTHFEIVEGQECPECVRCREHIKLGVVISHKRCKTCNTYCRKNLPIGRVEVVTFTGFFGDGKYKRVYGTHNTKGYYPEDKENKSDG